MGIWIWVGKAAIDRPAIMAFLGVPGLGTIIPNLGGMGKGGALPQAAGDPCPHIVYFIVDGGYTHRAHRMENPGTATVSGMEVTGMDRKTERHSAVDRVWNRAWLARAPILGLAAMALFAWACGGGDDTTDPDPENNPPVASGTIPTQTPQVGRTETVELDEYFSDPDGDALSYTAETANADVATVSVSGDRASVTGVSRGTTTITVTASDPDGLTAEQSFAAEVPNRAPVPVGNIPDLELFEREKVDIDVAEYFLDPDEDMLSYEVESSDGGVATAGVAGETVTITAGGPGGATVTVTASDPGGMSVEQSFSATVEPRPNPRVEFATGVASAPEGGKVELEVKLRPAPESAIEVSYSLGPDDDPGTDDADDADHGGGGGTLRIGTGATSATLEVTVRDDRDIEPTREVFIVRLDPPEDGAGYTLKETTTAVLTIEEGVCDRTPRVRDELIAMAGVDHCRETDDSHLAAIDTLDLRGPNLPGGAAGPDPRWSWQAGTAGCDPQSMSASAPRRGHPQKPMSPGCAYRLPQLARPPLAPSPQGVERTSDPLTELRAGDFAGLTQLGELWLFGNDLTELPPGLFDGLRQLERLLLGYNQLTEIPEGIFSGLSRLKDLSIQENDLTRLPPNLFAGLSRLEELWMHGNLLTELPAGISKLLNLRKLIAWENRLEALPTGIFSGLSGLEVISLSGNRLEELEGEVFADLTILDTLDLGDNRLTEVAPGLFSNLGSLEALYLHANRLEHLPNGLLDGLGELMDLTLSENRIAELEDGTFSDLSRLELLWLNDNRIPDFGSGTFSGLSSLRLLHLAKNQIADLESSRLTGLTSLETLVLNENPLPELKSGVFAGLTRLKDLWLTEGELSYVQPGAFNGLSSLSVLILDNSRLDRLEDGTFTGLLRLEELWLTNNDISELSTGSFTGMPRLELLVLSGNRLGDLPAGAFSPLAELEELWIGENEVVTLAPRAFASLGELRHLHLFQNQLSELPSEVFVGLSKLKWLDLQENPGTPFTLSVHLERTDATDLAASGPAQVVVALAEGAPFTMKIPLSVEGGTLSADTAVIEAGKTRSAEFTVTMDSDSDSGTQVTVGPPPPVPSTVFGVGVVAADTVLLFATSSGVADAETEVAVGGQGGGVSSDQSAAGLLGGSDGGGCYNAWARTAFSTDAGTRFGCGPWAPGVGLRDSP